MSKPKETPYRLVDAGFGADPASDWERAGLPFNPRDFPVDSGALAKRLAEVTDADTVDRLQSFDTRTTAAAEYERRINAIAAED
jgi:hypothetical protein